MKIFIVIPPGLEDLAQKEIQEKCPLNNYEVIKGGILAEVDHQWIFNAHYLLKIPTRLLLRITEFKVRDFPKLASKLSALHWNDFLSHPEPLFQVTTSQSRLMHTGRIEEVFRDILAKQLTKQPLSLDWQKKKYGPQTFYVRVVDDLLTLSVDLSGEALYKRGEGLIKGEAPLRENFASALIYELLEDTLENVTLFDPMCGSGTFLYEAQAFYSPSKRSFSFTENPLFKGKHFPIPKTQDKLPIKSVLGHEINSSLVEKLNRDYIRTCDSLNEQYTLSHPLVIICNPPYGERIKIQGKRGSFLKEALAHFFTLDPLKLGWLVPTDMEEIFKAPKNYRLKNKRRFRNGGLAVSFLSWEKIIQ